MSKSEVYSKIYKISNLVHQKDLTDKKDCDKLLKKLKEIIQTLEKD